MPAILKISPPPPPNAFSIAAGPGDIYSGGAMAFKPAQACNLTSVTVFLTGYTGVNDQQIQIQLCSDIGSNVPGPTIAAQFKVPGHNDGSLAQFNFDLSSKVGLSAGTIYWILLYGLLNSTSLAKGALMYCVAGANPSGSATFIQALSMTDSNFQATQTIPAISIAAEL